MNQPRRVVKLGGSLLEFDNLIGALRAWLVAQQPAQTIIVVGGGSAADVVRRADERFELPAQVAHQLAIRAMSLNTHLVAHLLPEATLADDLGAWPQNELTLFNPVPTFCDPTPLRRVLPPVGWHVTSDSIAAWLARQLGADELALLKSTLPVGATTATVAREGYCDAYFPTAAANLGKVRCVNLRSEQYTEKMLRTRATAEA